MILDNLRDIIEHTSGLGLDTIKLIGDGTGTRIESIAADKSIVMFGKLKEPISELVGTVGLSRTHILNGYLKFEPFTSPTATISVIKQNKNGEEIPSEIKFDSGSGHTGSYRFMGTEVVNELVKLPAMKDVKWDLTVEPTLANYKDFVYFNSVIGAYEQVFSIKTTNDTLEFHIGSGPTDRCIVPFVKGVKGTALGKHYWQTNSVISVLKLMETGKCKFSLANFGAIQIEIDSNIGQYTYVLPGKSK